MTVRREPVGVVAAIVPWNVPQFVIMTKLAPALLAGLHGRAQARARDAARRLPARRDGRGGRHPGRRGQHRRPPAARPASTWSRHPGVDKVAFTGSTAAGRRIAAICGEQLKRCTLELGGKSAAIILDDADLPSSDGLPAIASLMNNGQACVAQTRILAPRSRYDEVVDALADDGQRPCRSATRPTPAPASARWSPSASRSGSRATSASARTRAPRSSSAAWTGRYDRGWYVEPTVFADVTNDMRIAREEIFGPVLSVIPYEDEADAIRIANDSDYGLAGTVWTADTDHGIDVARQVRTGTYGVNLFMMDPNAPFGGYKASGLGRELGPEGLDATWSTSPSPAWAENEGCVYGSSEPTSTPPMYGPARPRDAGQPLDYMKYVPWPPLSDGLLPRDFSQRISSIRCK